MTRFFFFSLGYFFKITLDGSFLKVEAMVPKQAKTLTSGVLGNFDGRDNELDDADGNPIPRNDIVAIYNKQNSCKDISIIFLKQELN